MNHPISNKHKSVNELYRGARVFVTGASGFIGKVLVEKLLRSCPELDMVFVLLRSKKNQTLEQRIDQMTKSFLFAKIRCENNDLLKKIHGIEGDGQKLRLGISDEDHQRLKSCTVIFHLAACVRFDDQLSDAIKLNTRGTREICELAKTFPALKALVYVSTAYVQPKYFHIQENLYPVTCDWTQYIKYAETLDEDTLNALTLKLTMFAPNTYSFTKFLAEHVCNDYRRDQNLPITIYRPSIVSVADSEPAGYSDTFSGPNGLLLSFMTGIKRVHTAQPVLLDMIPVDICVKGMIVASAKHQRSEEMEAEIPVYNAASVVKISLSELQQIAKPLIENHLLQNSIGLPSLLLVKSQWVVMLLTLLFQIIPAVLIDGLLKLFKRKPLLMKYQRIIANVENSLRFFSHNVFSFETSKYLKLATQVCEEDGKAFNMKPKTDKFEYFRQGYLVTKMIVLNEAPKNEEVAKRRRPYWRALTMIIHAMFYGLLYKMAIFSLSFFKSHIFTQLLSFDSINLT